MAAGEQQRTQLEIPFWVLFGGVVFCSRGRPIATSAPANRPNAHLQRTDDALTMTSTVQRGILRRPGMIDRIVVMTISWMSALIIYDGWDVLRFIDVAAIILGPIAAIFAARLRRHPHRACQTRARPYQAGRVALIADESQFLLLALPPLALLAVLAGGAGCAGRLLCACYPGDHRRRHRVSGVLGRTRRPPCGTDWIAARPVRRGWSRTGAL